MTLIPDLERELVSAARRAAAPARMSVRSHRRVPLLVAAAVLALGLGAVALAASGLIGSGKPLKPPRSTPLKPRSGLGVPKPGSAQVLKIAVPDPAGGAPWGLRFVATTRGLGCLQVGRLVDGDIGVLGQDGVFANDGRFHPLAQNYFGSIAGPFPCGTLDAHGHAFAGIYARGVPASGLLVPSHVQPGCIYSRRHWRSTKRKPPPICPAADLRVLTLGMAGPLAKSVTYVAGGVRHTVPTVGEQGAYLLVQRISGDRRQLGTFEPLPGAGGGPIVRIDYRNGHACRIHARLSIQRICPPVGRVLPAGARPTAAQVRSPVDVHIGKGHFGRTVVVSFVARLPVIDATSAYFLELHFSGPQVNCRGSVIGPLLRDVRAGQHVQFHEPTNGCHGIFHGRVSYGYDIDTAAFPLPIGKGAHNLTVGRFTVDAR